MKKFLIALCIVAGVICWTVFACFLIVISVALSDLIKGQWFEFLSIIPTIIFFFFGDFCFRRYQKLTNYPDSK